MEGKKMNKFIYSIILALGLLTFQGCSDYFETNPDDILIGDDYISDINEFYSGYMGIAAKVADVADQLVILSELRGDLLEPTENAPQGLWEIYNYTNNNDNEFTNPSEFYDLIVNANDYIRKAIEYKYNNPNAISQDVFDGFLSAAIRYKVWAYLSLGKLYGKAIYFDDPMKEYQPDHTYPTMDLDQLIDQLLVLMNDGITIESDTLEYQVNGLIPFYFSEVIASDGAEDVTWDLINPDPQCLKTELDLWDENYDAVIAEAIDFLYADGDTKNYKITEDEHEGEWFSDIFTSTSKGLLLAERINATLYNYDNGQVNDLLKFLSNQEPNLYYLRPTEAAMNRFNNQINENGIDRGDVYRGVGRSFTEVNGQWVYRKLTHTFEDDLNLVYKTVDNIYMYRAPDMHFFLMEALTQKHLFREAEALLNGGMTNDYYTKYETTEYRYPFNDANIEEAFTNNKYPNCGIRFRVNLDFVYPTADSITEADKYQYQLDSLILEETCLESNGEARSLFAMIRHAKRYKDPSIVASRISKKYPEGKREEIYNKLMSVDENGLNKHWFIEFDIKNNPYAAENTTD